MKTNIVNIDPGFEKFIKKEPLIPELELCILIKPDCLLSVVDTPQPDLETLKSDYETPLSNKNYVTPTPIYTDNGDFENSKINQKDKNMQNDEKTKIIFIRIEGVEGLQKLECKGSDQQIFKIKLSMAKILKIDPEEMDISYTGKKLQDEYTLASYDIKSGSVLQLILKEINSSKYEILIRTPLSRVINLQVFQSMTITNVKNEIIKQFSNFIIDEILLNFNGKTLENKNSLNYYGIKNKSVLDMLNDEIEVCNTMTKK